MSTTLSQKGQIVIPAKTRKSLGLKAGVQFSVEEKNGQIILHPKTPGYYEKFLGIIEDPDLVKTLKQERQRDLKKERRKFGK